MAVVLGLMILVHELGHFAVAKLVGVRVEQFAIGFGKRVVGFRRGETDYRLNLLPLGGYVKMAGENPLESRTGDPGEFMAHPRWHRFLIAIAGPSMNILLAVLLVTGTYMVHYALPVYFEQPAVIGYVAPNSPAAKADLQPGDRIVQLGAQSNPAWEDVLDQTALSPGQPLSLSVLRGHQVLSRIIVPASEGPGQAGSAGWFASRPIEVDTVEPNGPAALAGMQPGDRVAAVNGAPVACVEALVEFLDQNKSKPLTLTVVRSRSALQLTMVPAATEIGNQTHYRLRFMFTDPVQVSRLPFSRALARSVESNKKYGALILQLVEKLVERKASIKQFQGPIGIGVLAGQAARQPGWIPLLELTALISLNLGIINLLPIPILDGGVILLLALEGLMRRDISQPIKERIYQTAFVFLLLIGVIVIYNDLSRYVPGLAGHLP